MRSLDTLKRHAALFDDMAAALGVDLEELAITGQLSIPDIEDAVLRCTACAQPDACQGRKQGQGVPPRFCRNTDLFKTLKRG